jgi:Fur family ferric uptake transcriptional regulator
MSSASSSRPRTRQTWQKQAIDEILDASSDFLSAQQVHEAVAETGRSVSLATVYRVLQAQVEDGVVDILALDDGQTLFRKCASTGHHHHLVCRNCRATEEIAAPKVEQWADHVGADFGYTDIDHTLEIYGLCPRCAHKAS